MRVNELMTVEPLVLHADESLEVAEMFMRFAHIRHLPVVDQGRVTGLVTHRDLLGAVIQLLEHSPGTTPDSVTGKVLVESIMRRDVRTVEASTDARQAIDIMVDHKYGCLPVTEDGQIVGIVTEADFLKYAKRCLDQGAL